MIYVKTGTYSSSSLVCNSDDVNALKTQVSSLNAFKNTYSGYTVREQRYQDCFIVQYVLGHIAYVEVQKTQTSGNTGTVTLFTGNPIGIKNAQILGCFLHVSNTKVGSGYITLTSSECKYEGDSYGNAVSYNSYGIILI